MLNESEYEYYRNSVDSVRHERAFEYRKWCDKIPYIKFDPGWEVKVIPPFGGAVVRFLVNYKGNQVSVYLDCYEMLGCMGQPYWEMYPYEEDVKRFYLNETDELINCIREELNR